MVEAVRDAMTPIFLFFELCKKEGDNHTKFDDDPPKWFFESCSVSKIRSENEH